MVTYQDFISVGHSEYERMRFALEAIERHKSGKQYKTAKEASLYYQHENPTIMRAQKITYNMLGKAVPDIWASNNKIASGYYPYFVNQSVQYLLGNGVSFENEGTKERLGKDFDYKMQKIARIAKNSGVSYAFYNVDHVDVFDYLEFVPLLDEDTGALMAGIRFWQLDDKKPLRFTIYEVDGYTEYKKNCDEEPLVLQDKRAYQQIVQTSEADGSVIVGEDNYSAFPIVPMYNNNGKSELTIGQKTIDAYDLMASAMVNNIDDANLIYWVIENCGGMDITDAEQFIEIVKRNHVAMLPNADDGAKASPHSIEAPYEANEVALERLRKQLFEDYMALDVVQIQRGNITATQINASYEPLNSKTDMFEYNVIECINKLLEIVGIEDKPTFTRSKIVNVQEDIQTIIEASTYLSTEYITTKILTLLGDADKAQSVLEQMINDDVGRMEEDDE